jgi:hypothetical protein
LLGIKDVKSIIKLGKSKRSPTESSAPVNSHRQARANPKRTAEIFLIAKLTAQIFAKPINSVNPQTDLDA